MATRRIFRQLLQNQHLFKNRQLSNHQTTRLLHCVTSRICANTSAWLHSNTTSPSYEGKFGVYHVQVRHKGHSHFQNIRANKMANDSARMRIMSKLSSDMSVAVREGGGFDPKLNRQLAGVIAKMEASNIPKAKIQGVLERLKDAGKNQQNVMVEIRGPRGSVFVVELFASNPKLAKDQVRAAMKKIPNARVSDQMTWQRQFDQVGVITVPLTADMDTNMDHYVEVAIESGAEDVIITENTDEEIDAKSVLKFHCDSKMVRQVEKEITQTHDLKVSSAEVDLIPHVWEVLDSEDDIQVYEAILEKLNKLDDLMKIFDNVTIPDE